MASSKKPAQMVALIKEAVELAKKGECKLALKAASKAYIIRRGKTAAVPRWAVTVLVDEYDRISAENVGLLSACWRAEGLRHRGRRRG